MPTFSLCRCVQQRSEFSHHCDLPNGIVPKALGLITQPVRKGLKRIFRPLQPSVCIAHFRLHEGPYRVPQLIEVGYRRAIMMCSGTPGRSELLWPRWYTAPAYRKGPDRACPSRCGLCVGRPERTRASISCRGHEEASTAARWLPIVRSCSSSGIASDGGGLRGKVRLIHPWPLNGLLAPMFK